MVYLVCPSEKGPTAEAAEPSVAEGPNLLAHVPTADGTGPIVGHISRGGPNTDLLHAQACIVVWVIEVVKSEKARHVLTVRQSKAYCQYPPPLGAG